MGIFRHRPPPPEQVEALKIADRTLRELAPIVCERVGYPEQAQQLRELGSITTAKQARHASRALRSLDRQLSKAPKTEAGSFCLAAIGSTALCLSSAAGDDEVAKMKIRDGADPRTLYDQVRLHTQGVRLLLAEVAPDQLERLGLAEPTSG